MSEQYVGPERRWIPRYLTVGPISLPYVDRDKALATIKSSFKDGYQIKVAFCNSNTMLHALRSPDYAEVLSGFLLLNDGVGIDICSYIFQGQPFPQNLNGTDFIPDVLRESGQERAVYLLGATPEWIGRAAASIGERFPNCRVVGSHHGYFSQSEVDRIIDGINQVSPDIVLVGLGNPMQEQFIAAYAPKIHARVLIGVGAFLDFSAGKFPRAPKLVQNLRLEWLYRLVHEPVRLGRRYTVDVAAFLIAVLRMKAAMQGALRSERAERARLRP